MCELYHYCLCSLYKKWKQCPIFDFHQCPKDKKKKKRLIDSFKMSFKSSKLDIMTGVTKLYKYHIHTDADSSLSWSFLTYFLHSVHEYFSLDRYTDLNWKYTDHSVLLYTLLIQVFFPALSCAQSMFFYKKTQLIQY